jgi:hypothetical protein
VNGEVVKLSAKKDITIAVFCAFGTPHLAAQESALLRAFCSSARRVYSHERARIILLTDEFFEFSSYSALFDEVFRVPVIRDELLLSRAMSYLSLVAQFKWDTPLVLLDYDILILKKIEHVFSSQHDVYVTCRNYAEHMPVNGGVVMLNNVRPSECYRFYREVVDTYRTLPDETLRWWGDQIALSNAVFKGKTVDIDTMSEVLTSSQIRVKLLERMSFNFTPYDVDSGLPVPASLDQRAKERLLNDVFIAHFKGPRKHLMLEWARAIKGVAASENKSQAE